jgi:hypothetical protein
MATSSVEAEQSATAAAVSMRQNTYGTVISHANIHERHRNP